MKPLLIALLIITAISATVHADSMLLLWVGSGGSGGGGGGGCAGTIDLSTGCAQPMLGVM